MAQFLTEALLRKFVHDDTSYDADLYAIAMDAAEQYLNDETDRQFVVASGTPAARKFRPAQCSRILPIYDCVSITSVVENGSTLTLDSHYLREPQNGITTAGETRPYNRLVRIDTWWYTDDVEYTVTVIADWGWAAIPAAAKMAGLVCAKAYLDAREVKFGLAALAESGGVGERQAKAVKDFIRNYGSPNQSLVAG